MRFKNENIKGQTDEIGEREVGDDGRRREKGLRELTGGNSS